METLANLIQTEEQSTEIKNFIWNIVANTNFTDEGWVERNELNQELEKVNFVVGYFEHQKDRNFGFLNNVYVNDRNNIDGENKAICIAKFRQHEDSRKSAIFCVKVRNMDEKTVGLITPAVEATQKRIQERNFLIRKHEAEEQVRQERLERDIKALGIASYKVEYEYNQISYGPAKELRISFMMKDDGEITEEIFKDFLKIKGYKTAIPEATGWWDAEKLEISVFHNKGYYEWHGAYTD